MTRVASRLQKHQPVIFLQDHHQTIGTLTSRSISRILDVYMASPDSHEGTPSEQSNRESVVLSRAAAIDTAAVQMETASPGDHEGASVPTPRGDVRTDPHAESRAKKRAQLDVYLAKRGLAGTRIVRSAEAAPVSYDDVPDNQLPRPANR